jgi:DNA segregation ATPase FtsK/SpoIIIE-like protein
MQNLQQKVDTVNAQDTARHVREGSADFQMTLNEIVHNTLRPTVIVLAVVLLAWAIAFARGESETQMTLAIVSAAVGILFFVFAFFLKRLDIAVRYSNPLAAVTALFILGNRLLGIAFTGELEQTTSLILLMVGAGFLILSTPWLIGVAVVTVISWIIVTVPLRTLSSWNVFAMELASAVALMTIIHLARRRSFHRQADLHYHSESPNAELERRAR